MQYNIIYQIQTFEQLKSFADAKPRLEVITKLPNVTSTRIELDRFTALESLKATKNVGEFNQLTNEVMNNLGRMPTWWHGEVTTKLLPSLHNQWNAEEEKAKLAGAAADQSNV